MKNIILNFTIGVLAIIAIYIPMCAITELLLPLTTLDHLMAMPYGHPIRALFGLLMLIALCAVVPIVSIIGETILEFWKGKK